MGDHVAQLVANVALCGLKAVNGELCLLIGEHADHDGCLLEIGRDLDAGDGDEAGDARIVKTPQHDGADGVEEGGVVLLGLVGHEEKR